MSRIANTSCRPEVAITAVPDAASAFTHPMVLCTSEVNVQTSRNAYITLFIVEKK